MPNCEGGNLIQQFVDSLSSDQVDKLYEILMGRKQYHMPWECVRRDVVKKLQDDRNKTSPSQATDN